GSDVISERHANRYEINIKYKEELEKGNLVLSSKDKDGFIEGTADREFMYQIQTPQVFKTSEIKRWYKESKENFTDDCALAERNGKKIKIVDGSYENIKLTTPEDLIIAENIIKKRGAVK
ncbi:MAG: 2-C-methyl-D-erythritol 4-phosphate cytidylyltransferase, partial [Bacillota bacterium]|nr:2-C-methyl-D-erythritol 4-phosphate cytidylyltransferase [Bacillota bacterium]